MENKKCYLILWMHRSWTSVLSWCLSKCWLETWDVLPPKFDNPKGFFENLWVLYLDEDILKYNDSSRDDLRNIKYKWTEEHLRRWVNIIKWFDNDYLIKEPRMCVLYDFWMEVFKQVWHNLVKVFINRDNRDICNSLYDRNWITVLEWEALCKKYKKVAIKCDKFINFKDFIQDPIKTIEFILWRKLNIEEEYKVFDHIDITLIHNTKFDV